tara:strand:- start:2134 stop:2577 length:444 start_codon:yes stop_codon:yes gene_type:complete
MEKDYIPFDVINLVTRTIAEKLKDTDITHVIGLARGGLVPATIMSYMLDKPLLTYGISSYKGTKKTGKFHTSQPLNTAALKEHNAHVLIVDDICDTGGTMRYITTNLALGGINFKTACIFTKEKHKEWLDHYGLIAPDNKWIVFPWE